MFMLSTGGKVTPGGYGRISEAHTRRFKRIFLAKEFGWPLDYIDSLRQSDIVDIYAVLDGMGRYRQSRNKGGR